VLLSSLAPPLVRLRFRAALSRLLPGSLDVSLGHDCLQPDGAATRGGAARLAKANNAGNAMPLPATLMEIS